MVYVSRRCYKSGKLLSKGRAFILSQEIMSLIKKARRVAPANKRKFEVLNDESSAVDFNALRSQQLRTTIER